MGTVKGNWLTGAHSGRACNHEDIYTKMNKKTGKCYSVKLCNPYEGEVSTAQSAQMAKFGKISAALTSWIAANKVSTASGYDAYQKVKAQFDRQSKYATLRGYMMAKNMAEVQTDGSVKITIGTYTATVSVTSSDSDESGTPATYSVSLSASPAAGGSVTGACTGKSAGSQVAIAAVANSGYTFSKWSDDNTNSSRTITVNSNITLQAIFVADSSDDDDENAGGGSGENEGDGDGDL